MNRFIPFDIGRGLYYELRRDKRITEDQYKAAGKLFDYKDQLLEWSKLVKEDLDEVNRKLTRGDLTWDGLKGRMIDRGDDQ